MIVQVVYCNHHTAALQLRERLAFASEADLNRAYGRLRLDFPDSELVLLSTCNRVELYTAQEEDERPPTHEQIMRFLSDFHQIPREEFAGQLLAETGEEAVRHLFRVASSIDSMVLGEPQIVSQVKEAYRVAQQNDACGPLTHALFQGAIRVSGRVRSETKLAEGRVSIASVAVGEFGKRIFERFDDKTVLIIGAGEMAEETLRYLKEGGVGRILIVNRSRERGERLAAEWAGSVVPWEDLDRAMAEADVIVSTTGAIEPIVDRARLEKVRQETNRKPVLILDLGAPRDFEPGMGDLDDNVFLYDIDDLDATCEQNRKVRTREIERADRIIAEETDRFLHEIYHQATGPIIKRLREEWHEVREAEVARLFASLSHLDPKDREKIERSIERIVNKLLHPPLETLRLEAKQGTPHGLLDALKRLFHLGE